MSRMEMVCGPIDIPEPGGGLVHEHVFALGTGMRPNCPDHSNSRHGQICTMRAATPRRCFEVQS